MKIIKKYEVFLKYIMSAGICLTIDLLLFTIFNLLFKSYTDFSIIIATVLARIVSSLINYSLNKEHVFKYEKGRDIGSFFKYYLLVIVQMMVSSYSVYYLYKLIALNETIIKLFVDIVLFVINFFVQKLFIFKQRENKERGSIYLLIISILGAVSLVVNPYLTDNIIKFNYDNIMVSSSFITGLLYLYYNKHFNVIERKKSLVVVSIIFSLLLIFGYSFQEVDSSYLVLGNYQYIILSIIKLFGYYHLFNLSLNLFYVYLVNFKFKKVYTNKWILYFYDHPMKSSIVVLFFSYIIYLIAYYPGVVGYDPSYQIKEMMGLPNFYADSVLIVSTKTSLTAFNPVVHTLLIGSLFKVGLYFGSVNLGIFLYTLIQYIVMIIILSYSLKFLKDEGVPLGCLLVVLGIYAFVPVFPYYAICAFKDTYFALFFMLFVIEVYKAIKYQLNVKRALTMILVAFFLCLFRKNGSLTVFLTLCGLIIVIKNNRKFLLLVSVGFLSLYMGYNKVIELCEITQTSPREVLSIPIQQTAALVVNREEIISLDDRQIIGKIIDYDKIKENYNPELSDPVKNTYNKYATEDDLKKYFEVWFKYLLKEPKIYIEATINNMYGYFYPNDHIWYFYHKKYNVLNDVGYDYHYNGLSWLRMILYGYGEGFAYVPVIGLLVNIGSVTWAYIYLLAILLESKQKKYALMLLPAFTIVLACVLGPVNTYYRYVLPYAISLPLILSLLHINKKELFLMKK